MTEALWTAMILMVSAKEVVTGEVVFFAFSFGLGIMILISHDIMVWLKCFRKQSFLFSYCSEVLFWTVAAVAAFLLQYKMNHGILRCFALVGSVLGMGLYQITTRRIRVRLFWFAGKCRRTYYRNRRKRELRRKERRINAQKQLKSFWNRCKMELRKQQTGVKRWHGRKSEESD